MKILITGGAGYIGSTAANKFLDNGHDVTIIDSLITGSKLNIPKKSTFIKSDIGDIKKLKKHINHKYDVVLHFAALIDNQESVTQEKKYLKNNFLNLKKFINYCIKIGIKNFIFSSSAAIYASSSEKINENSLITPSAPYGKSKLKLENFLIKLSKNVNYVILRYFNVAGVEKKMRSGFRINKNKSLFNNLCKSYIKKSLFYIYGKKYDTIDGTAIRDYIYVSDLVDVHYFFSQILKKKKIRTIINCGYGKGYSVLSVINKFNNLLNKKIKYKFVNKRSNDIGYSVADTKKLNYIYKFKNNKNKMSIMINTSIDWYKKKSK